MAQPGLCNSVDLQGFFKERLAEVRSRIERACSRAHRKSSDVTLVAVTKTVDPLIAAQLHAAGAVDLGENRPQELWHKTQQLPPTVRWHLIGHLQRNKVERTLPLVSLIHSVDSVRLLETIDEAAAKLDRRAQVLLEVNTSGEPQKHGFSSDELLAAVEELDSFKNIEVQGLMTMAALDVEAEKARPAFAALRALREQLKDRVGPHLSMGMSNDFEIAIEEGATLIRLGTILFEGLPGEAA